jgi:hypothetical protein
VSEFYFAWVDASETTFGPEHEREDEEVFGFTISHDEGRFPGLVIQIINPRVGLLAPGRQLWAWLAWKGDSTDGAEPLFFGRLVGIPQDMQEEIIALEFIARPQNVESQVLALAETLRVAPYWDPIWIAPELRDDPDAVLEARPALWHYDRVTHLVSISDINSGEDGIIDLTEDDLFDVRVSPRQVPGRRVECTGEVFWDQDAVGVVDLTAALLKAAKDQNSGNGQNIDTYTGGGLALDWPEEGDSIGGGWSVGESFVKRGNGLWVPVEFETVILNDGNVGDFPSWSFRPVFKARYDASRSRSERVRFTLQADVQPIVTEPGDEEVIRLSFASQQLNEPLDQHTDATEEQDPIGDARRSSYFKTDRGRQSLEYLIAACRARLLARARCVEITFETPWENGLQLSCRKNVRVTDPRIPGGEATGKVTSYALSCDGDSGELVCRVTIGCTAGEGNTVSAAAGTPDYVEDGYVEDGYQTFTGQLVMPIAGEVTYADFSSQPIDDDGIDFFNMNAAAVVEDITIEGTKAEQRAVLQAFKNDFNEAVKALNQVFTRITVELRPLNTGPFETEFAITVSDLMIPKTIDLEATA